jgi:hypothetical protein
MPKTNCLVGFPSDRNSDVDIDRSAGRANVTSAVEMKDGWQENLLVDASVSVELAFNEYG